jgi:16S rRNA (guanine966-N2)-methyltransferase
MPPGVTRAAMDRMRESLFAILGDLHGLSFLDLYCGSGAVGIEAASRGADPVVFVEKDRRKRESLKSNTSYLREQVELHFFPVEHYLRRVKRSFDLIFLDPPFAQKGKAEMLELVAARRILSPGGTLILHVPRGEALPERAGELALSDRRAYGGSILLFYRHRESGSPPAAGG